MSSSWPGSVSSFPPLLSRSSLCNGATSRTVTWVRRSVDERDLALIPGSTSASSRCSASRSV